MNRPPPQPTRFGSYLLDRKLAEGGMAEVFLARQHGFGGFEKQVVVKRILPSLSSHAEFVEMFLNEARLAARLNHGNVVQVIEAGEIGGQYYIAMEYIDGIDLRPFYDQAERTRRPTAPGVACRIVADLLAGLHYAHTATDDQGRPLGVVHRDVSPQNVLIARSGTVKIVDFGIAKATRAASQQTRVGQVKGKVAYLSPEQALGRPLDARSDVFACGIILWELCTGARLFSRPTDMATIIAVTEDEIPSARALRSELPEALEQVLKRALARSLDERYPSAAAMQRDLEQLIRSQGWPGDRRTLEKHLVAHLGIRTPAFGVEALAPPKPPEADQAALHAAHASAADFGDDGPTMFSPPPALDALDEPNTDPIPLGARPPGAEQAPPSPMAAPPTPPPPARAPSGMRAQDATPLSPPRPATGGPRTPSGMRAMPPVYPVPPHPVAYSLPYVDAAPRGHALRRIAVVVIAAVVCSGLALFLIDRPHNAPGPHVEAVGGAQALVTLEVSEPAVVDIDGHRTRVDASGELAVPSGRQLTVLATTVRGNGKEATRSIALPPAGEGERIPLKISFPR